MCADAELWHKVASVAAQSVEHFPGLENALDEQEARRNKEKNCITTVVWNEESQSMQSYL